MQCSDYTLYRQNNKLLFFRCLKSNFLSFPIINFSPMMPIQNLVGSKRIYPRTFTRTFHESLLLVKFPGSEGRIIKNTRKFAIRRGFPLPNTFGCLKSIHDRHLNVHQNQIVLMTLVGFDRLLTIGDSVDAVIGFFEGSTLPFPGSEGRIIKNTRKFAIRRGFSWTNTK